MVTAGGDDAERVALYLAIVGVDFEVLDPPEVASAAGTVADRLHRAAIRR
ncbi:MAG TPA: hypothetical protein VH496_10950 [Mycobacterium sp.]